MREITVDSIRDTVARLCIEANKLLPQDVEEAVREASRDESLPIAKSVMKDLCENIKAAREMDLPVCQDTGMAVVFLEVGQEVHISGGLLEEAVNRGVALGYEKGYLRKSIVADPLERVNTGDNTPAVIHTRMAAGDKLTVTVAPKGFGSENMSQIRMLTPAASREDIIRAVVDIVQQAGSNPCPPVVVGVGIGGNFEYAPLLAKKALCRSLRSHADTPYYHALEDDLLMAVNETGIGPQGFGGKTTALKVNVEHYPTHIAGLPLAVNIGCHVNRHKTAVL